MTDTQQRMDYALRGSRLYDVPVELVMPCDMLHNWRRRTKRLDRALIRAATDQRHSRVRAIRAARQRLATGRLN